MSAYQTVSLNKPSDITGPKPIGLSSSNSLVHMSSSTKSPGLGIAEPGAVGAVAAVIPQPNSNSNSTAPHSQIGTVSTATLGASNSSATVVNNNASTRSHAQS